MGGGGGVWWRLENRASIMTKKAYRRAWKDIRDVPCGGVAALWRQAWRWRIRGRQTDVVKSSAAPAVHMLWRA